MQSKVARKIKMNVTSKGQPIVSKVRYSPTEERLLEILRKNKGRVFDSIQLHDLFYAKTDERSWHSQQQIMSAMRSLISKTSHNKEKFRIERSERRGPHPIEFRLVEKK